MYIIILKIVTSDTNVTQVTPVRNECNINITIVTRVKNFDFDNGTSENKFSHPYIKYMVNERYSLNKSNTD